MNTKLADNIFSVGYVDWNLRDFHGYETDKGVTYNSYLIKDQKTALIDTVKGLYAKDLIENIEKEISLDKIDYIICNHAEPDHSGSMDKIVAACENAVVVCNEKCKTTLSEYFDITGWKFHIVNEGDKLSLGSRTLAFINTPMVHWPESMFTFVEEDGILFSMDAFGQHYASQHRFDDEVDFDDVMNEAKKYYANIIMCFGAPIAVALKKTEGLKIKMIAPAHGVIWRTHIAEIVAAYQNWVAFKPKPKVLIIYDYMWGNTKLMAEAIEEGIGTNDKIEGKLIYIRTSSLTEIATEVLDCAGIVFGSSTLNNGMMPMAGATLTYLKGLRPEKKIGFAFGSYGWAGGGAEKVNQELKETGVDIIREPLICKFKPTPEVLEECRRAGAEIAERALALVEGKTVDRLVVIDKLKAAVEEPYVPVRKWGDMFQRVLDDCSYGLYIVTSHNNEGKINGQISDALMQVTSCPQKVAISINNSGLTCEYIKTSKVFGVSILDKNTDMPLIGLFGFRSGREIDKLSKVNEYTVGKTGVPLVKDHAISNFECNVVQEINLGSHTVFIGELVDVNLFKESEPLTYRYYKTVVKGKVPANSPSSGCQINTSANVAVNKMPSTDKKKYVCKICGWIYDPAIGDPQGGIPAGTEFEDIPADWRCPVCGVSKSDFNPI